MKKYTTIFLLLFFASSSYAQLLFNKLEIGIGLSGPKAYDANHPSIDGINHISFAIRADVPVFYFPYGKKNKFGFKAKAMYEKTNAGFKDNRTTYSDPPIETLKFNTIGVKIMPFTYIDDVDAPNYQGPGIHSKGYHTEVIDKKVTETETSTTTETTTRTKVVDSYVSPGEINFWVRAFASIYIVKGISYIHSSEPGFADANYKAKVSGWGMNPVFRFNNGLSLVTDLCFKLKYKWTDSKGDEKSMNSIYAGFSLGVPFRVLFK